MYSKNALVAVPTVSTGGGNNPLGAKRGGGGGRNGKDPCQDAFH